MSEVNEALLVFAGLMIVIFICGIAWHKWEGKVDARTAILSEIRSLARDEEIEEERRIVLLRDILDYLEDEIDMLVTGQTEED